MKKNIPSYLLIFFVCIVFLLLPYMFTSTGSVLKLPNLVYNAHDRIYFFIYSLLLIFFFFNYYYLIPKIYFSNKQLFYFGIISLFLLFFLWISTYFDHPDRNFLDYGPGPQFHHDKQPPMPKMDNHHFGGPPTQYSHTVLVYLIGVVSSLLFAINNRLRNVEKEKMQSELSFLKAQINPHFLFNTLNSIYALAIKKDDKTADSVVQLSELMRYIITNANDDVIALEKELNYIDNFIQLQKTRLGNTVKINYQRDSNIYGKCITPLILISFIENAFKHGVNPNQKSEIEIKITIEDNYLTLLVSNNKVESIQSQSGIGLQNTIERLNHLYPKNHELFIDDSKEKYIVILKINVGC